MSRLEGAATRSLFCWKVIPPSSRYELVIKPLPLPSCPNAARSQASVALAPAFYLLRRSWRCSLAYSSSSDTPNSNSMMPQKTSRDDSKRARLLYGIISP
jgi:hypothetical protein